MLNISPITPRYRDRPLTIGPRRFYGDDGSIGLALRRAAEKREWRYAAPVSAIAAATMLAILILGLVGI